MNKILLITLLCSAVAFSQTPCESGMAGIYPCEDYDLL